MAHLFDIWHRTPKSPFVVVGQTGLKLSCGKLRKATRSVSIVVSEAPGFWKTRRKVIPIGFWNTRTGEFVSTDPKLDRDEFFEVAEIIAYLQKEAAGEFHWCPACNQPRIGPKIEREIGVIFRFF